MAIRNASLWEVFKFVNVFPSATPSTAVPAYISLKNYNRVTFLVKATKDSTGATSAITVNQATAVAGTGAKALSTFTVYGLPDSASGTLGGTITAVSDTLVSTTVSAGSFTIPTTASKNAFYLVEVRACDLDVTNNFDCVRLGIGDSSSSTHIVVDATAILGDPRYADTTPPTAILD